MKNGNLRPAGSQKEGEKRQCDFTVGPMSTLKRIGLGRSTDRVAVKTVLPKTPVLTRLVTSRAVKTATGATCPRYGARPTQKTFHKIDTPGWSIHHESIYRFVSLDTSVLSSNFLKYHHFWTHFCLRSWIFSSKNHLWIIFTGI